MKPSELLNATQQKGSPIYKIKDETRMMAIYYDGSEMVVGLGGTRPNPWDWFSNAYPEQEAESHLPIIWEMIRIYQPLTVVCAGHSQGGAHAEIIGKKLGARVVTFGGLPTEHGAYIHYLRREDPMAWLPVTRKGTVKKLGKSVLWPNHDMHSPKAYLTALTT